MSLRVSALQLPARYGAPAEQLAFAARLLDHRAPVDLVLLPETSLTGYVSPQGDFDLTRFAEPLDGPTHAMLTVLAQRFDCLVVGPLIERDGERCFNTLIGVAPDGARALHYRKRHPWFPERWATAGELPYPLISWRGTTITAGICFDLHFLQAEATAALDAAELLLFPSAWVEDDDPDAPKEPSRAEHLTRIATTHHLAVLNANWGNGVPRISGQGGSMLITADGTLIEAVDDQVRYSIGGQS